MLQSKCVLCVFVILFNFGVVYGNEDDGKSSLAFVFDVTGSMYNDLRQVREGAEMILNTALMESDVIADFVFVPFHDPLYGPATVTKNKDVFKQALNIVRVYGGGDCPEKSLHGIQLALNVSRPRSFLYVFTDATAADHKIVGKVLDTVQRKQSQVVFILTGHCNDLERPSYQVYQQIAAASSGQVFNLNKTNVHKMLEFVRSSIKGRPVNLASVSNPAGYNYTQGIPVDSTLGEVSVSVSGAKPKITVVDPKGEQVTGPPKLITTLDLSEIMVIKVMQPEPGNWTITVGSEEDYSVKVVGLSGLTFDHGFSVEQPRSLKETSYRPLQGTYNHLMISLTQTNVSVDIQYAEILNLSGKSLFELPLKQVDGASKIYTAEPFIPPNEFFYIAINGRDQYNQELRRIGATAIQAKLPDVPYLTAPKKVEAHSHSRVTLTCNVESLVPVTAQWTKDASRTRLQFSSLQTTSIDLVIEDMREEHVGTYRCNAHNIAGTSSISTELTIIVEPPSVTISPGDIVAELGDNLSLSCVVYSEALLLRNALVFEGTQNKYEIDINKEPNMDGIYVFNKTIQVTNKDVGTYSCVAANRGGITNQSIQISVKANPTAHILGPHTLPKHVDSELQIVCAVENAEIISWNAPNGTMIRELQINGSVNDVLDLQNVTDDGVWTCNAVRGGLRASDSVTVTALFKPIVSIIGPKNITIVNGTIHEIFCDVVAKPPPRILWHKETEKFLNNTIMKIEPNKYRSILLLDSRIESVQHLYFCFGENTEGIHQDSINISVRRRMTIINRLKDQSVQLYSQIHLQCEIDSYPHSTIRWYHNNTVLVPSSNVYFTDNNSSVYIKRVDFENLGMYLCIADNGFEKMELNGTISVHGLAPPVLYKEPKRLLPSEGESATITCRVLQSNPHPIISWQYQRNISGDYAPLPQDILVNNDRKELVLTNVVPHHTGVYQCIAENVIGRDSYDVAVVVQYPPKLNKPTEEVDEPKYLKVGDSVLFGCEATALPAPITVWTKDGKPLIYTANIKLLNTSGLAINNVTEYDSGLYTCNATNALGSMHRNYTLVVYDPPLISSSSELTKEVIEGQLVELPCSTKGVPTPLVEWTQNNEPIVDPRKYFDDFGLRFVANLTDFGEYNCNAINRFGNISMTYTLHVWVPPHITPPLETKLPVLVGANVSIQCDVVGFPIPTVQWQFNGDTLIKNTTDLKFNDIGNIYLTEADIKHQGLYVCIAENIAGIAKKSTYLKLFEPPKILDDNYTGAYLATDKDKVLAISCRATGIPKPFIVWSKDEFYLNNDSRYNIDVDGTLIIKSPSEDMSGNYVCIAKNTAGSVNKTVPVEIYALPRNIQSEETLHSVTLVEGMNEIIDCPVQTTQHSVKWYKNAHLISTGSLQFPNVSRDNASMYSCVVTNSVGSGYSKLQVAVEWPPKFSYDVEDLVEVVRGHDLILDCNVDAKPRAKVKWVFNSKPLVFEDKEYLKLINVRSQNDGTYKCIVSNIHGTIFRQFNLKVLVPPFISEFDMMDVQLKEGMNASLECNAIGTPIPTVKWTFNNTNWLEYNSVLSSGSISVRSKGLYRCDATNKAGATHIVYRVSVVSPAKVTDVIVFVDSSGSNVEDSLDVVLGSNIRISCKAAGSPIPDIQWIKQGRTISENRYDIDYADLTIHHVQNSDAGVYTCVASNEGGSDERKVKVNVLEPPKIFQTLFQNENTTTNEINLEVISEQAFYLHCHPYGNPFPQIYWFFNDIPLKLFDDSMVSTDFGEVIFVKKALQTQSGNYTCVARNSVGNTSVVYLVDVLVPPTPPKESTKKVTSGFGKTLQLVCPVEGSPQPHVMWIKHPYTEINEDSRITISEDRFTLSINNTEVSDSGKYSCIMTNKVGTTELVYDVTIVTPPTIAGNVGANIVEGHVVPLRRSIVLKCEADGHPMPKITWLKDTQQLSDNLSNIQRVLGNSLVAIWSVDARDAGQYICVAENEAGAVHRRYNVAVQVPGKWSDWSQWSYCNATCGLGYQHRSRICHYIDDNNNTIDSSSKSEKIILDESACKGPTADRRKCHMPPCDVEDSKPRWSSWSRWSECSATCGVGTQARTRRCKTKAMCVGDNVQIKKCTDIPPCFTSSAPAENDVIDSKEDPSDINSYLPEATFEMSPEINSHYSPDIEEFYSASGSQASTAFYDVNVTENLDHSERGPCDPGYKYNSAAENCEDVNECEIQKNQCHSTQVCVNTEGAYRCSCSPGYLSLGAGQRCMDVNECELGTDGCEYSCVNTAGGYVCACPRPLRLHLDRHHCVTASLYRQPLGEPEAEYLSTTIDFPTRYTKTLKNT